MSLGPICSAASPRYIHRYDDGLGEEYNAAANREKGIELWAPSSFIKSNLKTISDSRPLYLQT